MASPTVIQGQALGSIITVNDSAALATLSTQGITIGTPVFNYAVGSAFTLTVSTAALVTDQVVAVSGITGLRWIKQASGLTTAQAAYINTWYQTQQAFMSGKVPALTEYVSWKAGLSQLGGPGAAGGGQGVDAGIEGGAFKTASAVQVNFSSVTVWQNAKTSPWAVAFRAAFSAISAAPQDIGVFNAAGSHFVAISASSVQDATNFTLRVVNSSESTPVVLSLADTNFHDFVITYDGSTTITVYIDGVSVGTQTSLTNLTTEAAQPGMINTSTAIKGVSKAMWGYVAV